MLEDHKDRYHVKLDACRDPFIRCRPTSTQSLDDASIFDDGPEKMDIWVFQTARPIQTAKAIIANLAKRGLEGKVSQQGDEEVIVRVIHGGDLAKQLAILESVHADRAPDLSEEDRERRREAGRKMAATHKHKPAPSPRIDAETPARVQTPPKRI